MARFNNWKTQAGGAIVLGVLLLGACAGGQEASHPAIHVATQERLETEAWWPTMATAPLGAYAGSAACAGCHLEHTSYSATGMQRAAVRPADAHILSDSAPGVFRSGAITYSLSGRNGMLALSGTVGGRHSTQNLDWVFGAGDLAHTFLYKMDGRWFQSEVSFYTRLSALEITTGFAASTSTSPAAALGNVLSPAEARTCFSCHMVHAVTSAGLDPAHAEAGVGCESCHGPGRQHVEVMTAERRGDAPDEGHGDAKTMFQPGSLSPSDSIDFCGACHRSFADASLSIGPQADKAVVRFQPYRLEESRCWLATGDKRLTCIACHDPHKPLNRDLGSYDRNCLQCHSGIATETVAAHKAPPCPKAQSECVTCHMPKIELPSMHGAFTDHFIRIVREGETLPR